MVGSKTPGGQAPSEKFLKEEAERQGLGAPSAPDHKEHTHPLNTAAAEDSGDSNIGITAIHANNPSSSFASQGADGTVRSAGAPTADVPKERVDDQAEAMRKEREP